MSDFSLRSLKCEKYHKAFDSINIQKGKKHDEIFFMNNRQCWPALSPAQTWENMKFLAFFLTLALATGRLRSGEGRDD